MLIILIYLHALKLIKKNIFNVLILSTWQITLIKFVILTLSYIMQVQRLINSFYY